MEGLGGLDVAENLLSTRITIMEKYERYARQIILKEVGEQGQEKIQRACVLVIGAGGLGSPVLFYLAAAGIGTLGFMDDDVVSESNLQRQILYDSISVGLPKVDIARRKLELLNPACRLIPMNRRLTPENVGNIIPHYDVIVDATDNLSSRYVINDACVKYGKPFVYGSICEFQGQVSVFNYQGGPTYRDLYPYTEDIHKFRQPAGVIGALPGTVGSIQATEVLKIILGNQPVLSGKLLLIDLLQGTFRTIHITV